MYSPCRREDAFDHGFLYFLSVRDWGSRGGILVAADGVQVLEHPAVEVLDLLHLLLGEAGVELFIHHGKGIVAALNRVVPFWVMLTSLHRPSRWSDCLVT